MEARGLGGGRLCVAPEGSEGEEGTTNWALVMQLSWDRGLQLSATVSAQGFWCCAAVSPFFHSWGKGRRKRVVKMILGRSGKVVLLFDVVPNQGFGLA